MSRAKKRSFRRHTEKEEQSISLHPWTFVISKFLSWNNSFENTKAVWLLIASPCATHFVIFVLTLCDLLRGLPSSIIVSKKKVKGDSGSYEVFTEQGSFASQMTA